MTKVTGRQQPRTAGPTTPSRTSDPVPGTSRDASPPLPASPVVVPPIVIPPVVVPTVGSPRSPQFVCPECGRPFVTKIGLGVHKRRVHPAEANEEVNVERIKAQWSDEEMRLMAREEALATRRGVRFLNQHLLTVVPGRTLEAIKGKRRMDDYRRLVAAALESLSEESSGSEAYLSASSTEGPEEGGRSTGSGESRSPPIPASARRSTSIGHREAILQLIPVVESVLGWNSSALVEISRRYLDGLPLQEDSISRWIASVFPPASRRLRPPPRRVVNPGRSQRRRDEYSRVQRMYRFNMSRCLKGILDGEAVGDGVVPDVREMTWHWGPFFSRPSQPVPPQSPFGPDRALEYVWEPVTPREVAQVTLPLGSAAGLDTISVRQWRAVPASIKALLFNTVMATGGFPPSMLVSRTVFIPKKCDCPTPADFRPISVMSVVVRHLHKVLACRLGGSGLIDLRQRCFDDGCSENIAVLAAVILESRTKLRELHVASLDVAKAFDSVSHHAITSGLVRRGLPMGFVEYVGRMYNHSHTVFEVRGERSEPVRLGRGVRQGDPLSPFLFCLLMDRVLGAVSADVGFGVGGASVNSLAFADDILLITSTQWGMQTSLQRVEDAARDQGLEFNHNKCSVLSIIPAGKRKKVKIVSTPSFRLRDGFLPQLQSTSEWRYLGVDFRSDGPRETRADLLDLLDRLSRAPLKPQQRLKALRCFLVPRFYHCLVLGRANLGRLRALDIQIRAAVRRWLRLPHDTAVGFFHASVRDGGLGVPSFATTIPGLTFDRLRRLGQSSSPAVRAVAGSAWVSRKLAWAKRILSLGDEEPATTLHSRREWWSQRLYNSVDGRELRECPKTTLSSWWVDAGSLAIPGRDYVQYAHVWINCLPTLIRTTRGIRRADRAIRCRAGCQVTETAAHVIQQCHRTHGGRIKRHNAVANTVAAALRDVGWTVEQEPVFDTNEGRRKPDLLCTRGGDAYVVDAQIVGGATSLDDAHERKRAYYGDNISLRRAISLKCATDRVQFTSCTLSWRGIWSSRSADALLRMGLTRGLLRGITTRVLQGSSTNWTRWNQMTTMVFAGAPEPRMGIG